jgi:hypothetical protein
MKRHLVGLIAGVVLHAGFLCAQEVFDVKIPVDEIKKIDTEQHYPIKVTFRVLDESGGRIAGATINVGVDSLLHVDGYNNYRGETDSEGLFVVESRGRGCTEIVVSKDGYYASRPEVGWDGGLNPGGAEMQKNGGFKPWNPIVDVILKKVGNPIPMMVRLESLHFAPKLGEEIGFDLLLGDWVEPNGKGKISDLFVRFESLFVNEEDFKASMAMRFSNPNDGFLPLNKLIGEESSLKYPRIAPEEGYLVKNIFLAAHSNEAVKEREPVGYIFRIRSKVEPGTQAVVSAFYGKVVSLGRYTARSAPIKIVPYLWKNRMIDSTPAFQFNYYVNPTSNDRNLECDQHTNLAPGAEKGVIYDP